jgi:hypothetical protein
MMRKRYQITKNNALDIGVGEENTAGRFGPVLAQRPTPHQGGVNG